MKTDFNETKQIQLDPIYELLKENKVDEVINYINDGKLAVVDSVDEHGTTPLQYAAFRGFYDVCKILTEKGADVNAKSHDQGYSALMFAAISNHKKVVSLLLENNADPDYTNLIGRTAAQMASFVNSFEAVDIINSYISKSSLEYYTEVHSLNEKEPKLPKGECLDELHKLLINSASYSPIRILKLIKNSKNDVLMTYIDKIIKTLDAFSSKAFKNEKGDCPNDILSFKLHYYKYLFEYLQIQKKNLLKKYESNKEVIPNENDLLNKLFEYCMKQLISEEEISVKDERESFIKNEESKVMYRVFEDKFLRECIRQYPYKESALLRQMVTILSRTSVGNHPSALYVITSCLNGQRLNEMYGSSNDTETSESKSKPLLECSTCYTKSTDAKWCTHCKKVAYCDQTCQKIHWPLHKKQNFEISK